MKQVRENRKGAKLRISEIYRSLQGEGLLTGTASVFVRTSGCNLRCWFCDTPFSSWHPEGDYFSVPEILSQVALKKTGYVVLTGGEPLIFGNLHEVCQGLHDAEQHITIETAGTIYQQLECDLISISPKLSGSAPDSSHGSWHHTHNRRRQALTVVQRLMDEHPYQLKFVVDSAADTEELLGYLHGLGPYDPQRVLVMPQGIEQEQLQQKAAWLMPWCEQHGLKFCPRAHIEWYGNRRGT